ncbi:MAG: hypothetical protein MJZ38_00660 [archaeon]|nr:hypothetical protein [archaeon]
MALDKKTLLPLILSIVVAVAVIASAAFVITGGNESGESKNSIVIEEGQTLTQAQLDDLKSVAKTDAKVKLTFKSSEYTVVFDNKAIQSILFAADLSVTNVDPSTLDETNKTLFKDSKVLDFKFGTNSNFKDGTVTVSVPYELAANEKADDVVVSYLTSNNAPQQVNGKFEDGMVTFTTNHFSSYAVSVAKSITSAGLKVLGNVNGDNVIDAQDVTAIRDMLSKSAPLYLFPIADADNNGTFDEADVTLVEKVANRENARIWHIVYHDVDGDGTMDTKLVDTAFPVTSTIITGSANSFILLYTLGIIDEVKGASYSDGNDTYLYGDTYLLDSHTKKFDSSAMKITFEDGKSGSSDVINKEHVTLAISDWNRSYLTNEDAFESANVDVIRLAAASVDPDVYTHSISLLGLLFNKGDRAATLINLYDSTFKDISDALKDVPADKIKKVIASSTTGAISSQDSDYTAFCKAAGAMFGLEGYNFGGSTSISVADNLGIFDTRKYDYNNIVHIRTALTYAKTTDEVAAQWAEYANQMSKWDHAYDGQVLVSGSIPVPVRVAYIAYTLYNEDCPSLSRLWADNIHSSFAALYNKSLDDAPNHSLAITSSNYKVTISEDVTVTDMSGNPVKSGAVFAYGTKLHIVNNVTKEGFVCIAAGSTVDDNGDFIVCNNISAKYVDSVIFRTQEKAVNSILSSKATVYGKFAKGADDGVVQITFVNYNKSNATKSMIFEYHEDLDEAKAAFATYKDAIVEKNNNPVTFKDEETGLEIYASFSNNLSEKYASSTIYCTAVYGHLVVNLAPKTNYFSHYYFPDTTDGAAFMEKSVDDRFAFFEGEVNKFVQNVKAALLAGAAE